jgi:hypothetical protein
MQTSPSGSVTSIPSGAGNISSGSSLPPAQPLSTKASAAMNNDKALMTVMLCQDLTICRDQPATW